MVSVAAEIAGGGCVRADALVVGGVGTLVLPRIWVGL